MTTTNQFKLGALSLAMTTLFTANTAFATADLSAQANINFAQTAAKLQHQGKFGTQFIIKYKNSDQSLMGVGTDATTSQAVMNQRAQSFVQGFASKKSNVKAQYVRPMALSNHHVMRVDRKLSPAEANSFMQEIAASGNVEYIEIDQMLQPFAAPNDPRYADQWHYYEPTGGLNLPSAWDRATGAGVTVAVLDTGYRPHVDLAANILPGYDMISNLDVANDGNLRDNDARDPGDAITRGECGTDSFGYPVPSRDRNSSWHGTHVAGTVAAVTNNGQGVAGVAYGAKVVPVRVLGKCGGLTSDIADGIIWASGGFVSGAPSNANPADVINMSLGGEGSCSPTTQNAINQARGNGTVVVVAAGNDNDNASSYNPGNCNGVINVASTNRSGSRASYSNYGSSIDVAAPGGTLTHGVLSTYNTGTGSPSFDSYGNSQGTSMAAPHVAGVAALIKQAKPSATPDEIESIIKTTTRSFPGSCSGCGTGIVDANAAVLKAFGQDPELPKEPFVKTLYNLSGSQGTQKRYSIEIPEGAKNFTVTTSSGQGDVDLGIYKDGASTYACLSQNSSNAERCSIASPSAGKWIIELQAYYSFTGLTMNVKYDL
ncbi:S8 family peptidase [Pseudoalteromonas sp. S16_S37]|uniref:S8 family peptidase n=1 Tax=Pseudoalteromonas sp. S16_S37 TaxID=2720228 RepID=UPI001680560F|nr:S8 family peptidase [Pseudoalteromonas sp. S16_S37]MBD1583098.1 S8 family serine peptidase [Pseudoalteromonas sp. S16_S37]